MGVPFPALLCFVCVFLFPDGVLSALQQNIRCCFALFFFFFCALKHLEVGSGISDVKSVKLLFMKLQHSALKPDQATWTEKLHRFSPSLSSTMSISAQHGDGVCSARWLPGLKYDATAERSPNTTCFLPSSSTISLLLLSFSVCLSLSPLKERNICSRLKGDTLNTSSF